MLENSCVLCYVIASVALCLSFETDARMFFAVDSFSYLIIWNYGMRKLLYSIVILSVV